MRMLSVVSAFDSLLNIVWLPRRTRLFKYILFFVCVTVFCRCYAVAILLQEVSLAGAFERFA